MIGGLELWPIAQELAKAVAVKAVVDIVRNYTGPWAYEPHDSLANLGLELSRRASDRWALLWRDLTP